ncbi:MFS polyamine transporter [Daedalea quercina L-15889]|uniref:MFS polyamine transporter n=1 Tax=Daedalea quercina L-15889 TaxID=1314783 RepID=A0A165UJU8_9APHY|nr:MFS polyamine transporter [Daedalea quercina L-15889]
MQVATPALDAPNAASAPAYEQEQTRSCDSGREGTLDASHDEPEKSSQQPMSEKQVSSDDGVIVVDWDGPDDPANPRNWSSNKKWAAAITVSAFTFISPISSSMVAPAAAQIAEQFHITSSVETSLTVSVFVLAYAFGPLFLGPLSEVYGRVHILRGANLWYTAWNLGCGFAQNSGQLIAFRFMAGLGGSAPLAAGGAVLSDMWPPEQRGKAIAIYSLAPLLGPVIGPVAGGWIAERSTWRWVFWSTTVVAFIIQICGLVFLQETLAPILLQQKADRIRKTVDPEKGPIREVRTAGQIDKQNMGVFWRKALIRPFAMFVQEPIIQLFGVYMAFIYGVIYLVLTTIPGIFTDVYHEDAGIGGLHYIALGLGLFVTTQINARVIDRIYQNQKARNGGIGKPEYRLITVLPGTALVPAGLLMSGWGTHTHWIVVDIGLAMIGSGLILTFQGMQTYVIDAFTLHAASALAAVSFLRSIAGFGFPLFAPAMYEALGYGVGDTILAAVAIVVGPPAVFTFWKYGEKIRGMSRHARRAHVARK